MPSMIYTSADNTVVQQQAHLLCTDALARLIDETLAKEVQPIRCHGHEQLLQQHAWELANWDIVW